jgi:cation diffusion facilitator CzcD-associated flavoprotein CzcO
VITGRIYNTFWTQWTIGLSEFSDMPMEPVPESDQKLDFYRAKWTTQYLEQYVDRKCKEGRTLRDRIHFRIEVERIQKVAGRWEVTCKGPENLPVLYSAEKLIVASGLTSVQNMPTLPGREQFGGLVMHSEDFGSNEDKILNSEDIKRIAVIGGGKSSADMIYEAVKAGKEVSWIIRTTGAGAAYFAPGSGQGPYKNAFEIASTRLASSLQPTIFNSRNWWTHFLHRTAIGNSLLMKAMAAVDSGIRKKADYKGRKSDKGFQKLEYDTE